MSDNGQPVILLAEDNPDHAELILSCLEKNHPHTRVVVLSDGEQALEYLERRGSYANAEISPRPVLILLDLRMPKVGGLEVLRRLKDTDTLKHIPVVILTTSNAEQDICFAYENHVNSYLVKPEDYGDLEELVSQLNSYWLETNCLPPGCC